MSIKSDCSSASFTTDASVLSEQMVNELQCNICYEVFVEPVTLDCGHSFCRTCLSQSYNANHRICPVDRAGKIPSADKMKVNTVLRNLVKVAVGSEIMQDMIAARREDNLCAWILGLSGHEVQELPKVIDALRTDKSSTEIVRSVAKTMVRFGSTHYRRLRDVHWHDGWWSYEQKHNNSAISAPWVTDDNAKLIVEIFESHGSDEEVLQHMVAFLGFALVLDEEMKAMMYNNSLTQSVAAALGRFPKNGTLCRDALYVLSNMAAGPATAEGGVVEMRKKAIVENGLIKVSVQAMLDHCNLHDVQAHALVLLFNLTTVTCCVEDEDGKIVEETRLMEPHMNDMVDAGVVNAVVNAMDTFYDMSNVQTVGSMLLYQLSLPDASAKKRVESLLDAGALPVIKKAQHYFGQKDEVASVMRSLIIMMEKPER